MKIITRYAAKDGSEFASESACTAYEKLCQKASKIMVLLSPLTAKIKSGFNFANGSGYIQHDASKFNEARNDLLKLFKTKIDHHWIDESMDGKGHPSYVARVVGEYGIRCFEDAWQRILCTDKSFREWGHPEEGTQKQLN